MAYGASAFAALQASVTLANGQPGIINPSETTVLQISLSNDATSQITGAAFSNSLPGTLPDGLKIAGAATYTCTDSAGNPAATTGAVTAVVGTQSISLAGGTIPVQSGGTSGICTISIPVTAGTSNGSAATYSYTIASGAVTGTDGGGPVSNTGAATQSIQVRTISRPSISKGFGTSSLYLGGTATTLTITLTNNAAVAIGNFSVTDNLPANIKIAATPNTSASCPSGVAPTVTAVAGGSSVSATGGTLAASGTCTIQVDVEGASTNGGVSWTQTNSINASSNFFNDIGISAAANASASVTVTSPLSVAKNVVGGAMLADGQTDSFRIVLTNHGTGPLTVTGLTDDPIDGTTAGNTNLWGLKVSGAPSVTCTGAGTPGTFAATANNTGVNQTANTTVAAGGSCTVLIPFTAHVQTSGTPVSYTNTLNAGQITTSTAGVVSQNASASVLVADDLRVQKSVSPSVVASGSAARYQITVQNFGASAVPTPVAISDSLGGGQTFITGTVGGFDYTPTLSGTGCSGLAVGGTNTTPTFTITTVPGRSTSNSPGACTVTFYAMTSISGTAPQNVIVTGGVCYNSGAKCNGSPSNSVSSSVQAAVLTATKAYNLSSPRAEGTVVRMTITLNNWSANTLVASVSDNLPTDPSGGQMRVATPANASSTCSGSPVITAVAGTTSVAMTGATVPGRANGGTANNAGSCTLQVDVVAGAGTYTNTANLAYTETYMDGSTHTGTATATASAFTFTSALCGNTNPCTKAFSPASVSSGGHSRVTVHLTNTGALALTGVGVTDPLPSGMVLANPSNAYTTCAGTPVITATAGASSAVLSGATIAGNGSCDFIFDVTATGSANWVNSIPAGNIVADGGVRNQNAVAATLTFVAPNNPSVAKATNPSTLIFPGQVSQLTITVQNGSQAVTNLRLTDYFTADGTAGAALNGMMVAPTPAASTTCPGGSVTATPSTTSVTVSGVSLAANATCTVTVNVTSTTVGGITNHIPAGSIVTDQGLSNSGPAATSLTTGGNLGVTKQFTPNVIKPNETSRLRITFYNPTAQPVSAIAVTDTLPAGLTVAAAPNTATTCVGATVSAPASNQVQVSGGTLPAATGATPTSCYVEIDVTAASQGDYMNLIAAGTLTATTGGVPTTNAQPASDLLRVKSPLQIQEAIINKTLDAVILTGAPFTNGTAAATAGTPATLTIRLRNPNSAALTAAAFNDVLPDGLVIATTPNASTDCVSGSVFAQPSGTSVRLSGATIPANGACTVTVDVLSNITGTHTDLIARGDVTTFEGVTNVEPTSAQIIISSPPTVNKQFSPAVIPPGGTSTLTVVLGNTNSSSITLSSAFDDTLPIAPDNVVVAATPNVSTTCSGGVGAVTAVAGAGTVSYASGAAIPAGGCSISVDVTANAAGDHINNIPAGALVTNVGSNQQPANATLTISTLGFISGRVFTDKNAVPNGTYQAGVDTPLAGVSIELHSGATCSAPLTAVVGLTNPATTDGLGNYLFSGLPADTYSVCQTAQPTATLNGITTAGTITTVAGSTGTPGTASNPTTTTSQIVGIVLNANGTGQVSGSTGNNFAEVPDYSATGAAVSGHVWRDTNHNRIMDGSESVVPGWTVELLLNGTLVATTHTDNAGAYLFSGLVPGSGYQVRFRDPVSGSLLGQPLPNETGSTFVSGSVSTANPAGATNAAGTLSNLTLSAGTTVLEQSLPLDPSGVIYDSVTRLPVSGATITISGPGGFSAADVVGGSLSQTTGSTGFYQFLLFNTAPAGVYTLTVTSPAGYLPAPSALIPACTSTPVVGAVPSPALVQSSNGAPAATIPNATPAACPGIVAGGSATTQYFFSFNLNPVTSANVLNNHIPIDPVLSGAIVMTKTTPMLNVVRGDLVPYTVTATNTLSAALANINVIDHIPPGFRYRTGTATLNGVHVEPSVAGRDLTWSGQSFTAGERKTFKMILVVGSGVSEGTYVNQTWSVNSQINAMVSNLASAAVRVVPDPNFDCTDIIGKVFDDKNANGYQDQGEPGIANVRVATPRGLLVTSDAEGRFHVTCADVPQQDRGSNFVMKLDERTLPSGYRLTTENPRDVRATRGKMVKLNFGATVHRVVRVELNAAAFVADSAELLPEWAERLKTIPAQLKGRPSVLRVAYALRKGEDAGRARQRVDGVSARVQKLWHEQETDDKEKRNPLVVETELEGAQ
ncbi:MAG TPA: SdrD B-like domain-containing protein [Rhodocyclaceae bacterium]|nr:SdrD B-like domain-containing protein [Rhodocyclaceae bacterium]